MFKGLLGVGRAADPRLDMVTSPAEGGIADLDVDRDSTDTGENERPAFVIDSPITPASRRAGLALQEEFYDGSFIGFEHLTSPFLIILDDDREFFQGSLPLILSLVVPLHSFA
jgi:hypothetical protein